jgi:hypothetical protein
VNVALWLLPLEEAETPKENKCHVRTRLGSLLGPEREDRVAALFDVESDIDDGTRRIEMTSLVRDELLPVLVACGTIDGLRASDEGKRLQERSLVGRAALELLGSV